jgi:DNA polymerase-3 subunit delta
MPTYFFWGEDDFTMAQAIQELRDQVLDPNWLQFNYHKLIGEDSKIAIDALNQAMTPPFGLGGRLVWLSETNLTQQCPETLLSELQRTLPVIPDNSHLLITSAKKPDSRLKSTKLLQKYAKVQDYSPIPPWKTEELTQQVQKLAQKMELKLTPGALTLLAESIGNNTRQLWSELEKLKLYRGNNSNPLTEKEVISLINPTAQNSLQLAQAIRDGDTGKALNLLTELINHNEHPLRIIATLVGQFRTWTFVKLKIEAGEKDERAIAKAAEIGNPKRIYFIRKEIQSLKSAQLLESLDLLLEAELSLKRGGEPLTTLQTKVIEMCQVNTRLSRRR